MGRQGQLPNLAFPRIRKFDTAEVNLLDPNLCIHKGCPSIHDPKLMTSGWGIFEHSTDQLSSKCNRSTSNSICKGAYEEKARRFACIVAVLSPARCRLRRSSMALPQETNINIGIRTQITK